MPFLLPLLIASLIHSSLAAPSRPPIVNPSFDITRDAAIAALKAEAEHPAKLDRPLVILGGFMDVGVGTAAYQSRLRPLFRGKIVPINFADCTNLWECRQRVSDTLDKELGNVAADHTAEVDVIGQSLGGLIAMQASLDDPKLPGKRLTIHRLFTVSSPLQGAKRAELVPWNLFGIQRDCRPGSALGQLLAHTSVPFEIDSYTRLRDSVVGERYAWLPGHPPFWIDTPPHEPAHAGAFHDPRILLDIVRRLRHEPPIAHDPPAPLPADGND